MGFYYGRVTSMSIVTVTGNEYELPTVNVDEQQLQIEVEQYRRDYANLFSTLTLTLEITYLAPQFVYPFDCNRSALINLGGKWHEIPIAPRPDLN